MLLLLLVQVACRKTWILILKIVRSIGVSSRHILYLVVVNLTLPMNKATYSWWDVIDTAAVMVIPIANIDIHRNIINIGGIWQKLYGISISIIVVVCFSKVLKIREKMSLITTVQ